MKKFWIINKRIIVLLFIWRIALFFIEKYSPLFVPMHVGYNGVVPWANHDGIYYLRIAQFGYFHLSEAFFPLYPIVIFIVSHFIPLSYWAIAIWISYLFFVCGILMLHTVLYKKNTSHAWWTVIFLISFPTSFFFSAAYPTSLLFFLTVLIYICVQKKLWIWCGILGALASATQIFGVVLFVYVLWEYIAGRPKKIVLRDILPIFCMPVGLALYMIYLYVRVQDPLFFFHMQPLFGANRGTDIVLLPQVFWRYGKILFTAFGQPTPVSYFISFIEFAVTLFGYFLIWWGIRVKERWSLLVYSTCALTLPTLTGTFSSVPRYIVNVFPLFFILGKLDNKAVRFILLIIFVFLQIILSALFLRGWFVA